MRQNASARSIGAFTFAVLLLFFPLSAPAQNSQTEGMSDLTILPFVYYTPETKTAFVLTGIYTWRDPVEGSRPSSLLGFATITTENQRMFSVLPEIYTSSGARITLQASAVDFPDKFYGIGSDTREEDEEDLTRRGGHVEGSYQFRVLPDLFAGPRFDWEELDLEDIEPGGLLDSGSITGSEGGVVFGAGLQVTYDTRDDVFWPSKGVYGEGTMMLYSEDAGSDFDYETAILDLRGFFTPRSWTLAFQQYLHLSGGEPPFDRLAQLGGAQLMRGYFRGRFRDKNLAAIQAESRIPLSSRFSLVVFTSAGSVASSPGDLMDGEIFTALGSGLRYRLSEAEAVNFRFDLAFGEGGNNGVYFTIREAF